MGQNRGNGWCDIDLPTNSFFFTFGDYNLCANFSENRSRNATVRVSTDTHAQTQTGFIICPMLYAIALAQIKIQVIIIL